MRRSQRCWLPLLLGAAWLAAAPPAAARGADGEWSERRSSHFVLLQDVAIDRRGGFHGSVRFEREVLATLEDAHDRLHQYLGLRTDRPITVQIYDAGIYDAAFAGLFRFPAAGFYQGVIRVRGGERVTVALQRVLHHELVHAAFDQLAPSLVLPAWFNEGVAEWFEARAVGKRRLSAGELNALRRAAAAGGLFDLAVLSPPSFSAFGPEAAGLAYLQSYGMIEHLVRRHGERELRDWVLDTVRKRRLSDAFRKTYRFALADLPGRFASDLGS
ncbi:MAG: hypothetical protein HKP30_08215 [Myxococcales bacterium]|nr:hypothetical protein [Myxococcales bacterium]